MISKNAQELKAALFKEENAGQSMITSRDSMKLSPRDKRDVMIQQLIQISSRIERMILLILILNQSLSQPKMLPQQLSHLSKQLPHKPINLLPILLSRILPQLLILPKMPQKTLQLLQLLQPRKSQSKNQLNQSRTDMKNQWSSQLLNNSKNWRRKQQLNKLSQRRALTKLLLQDLTFSRLSKSSNVKRSTSKLPN